MRTYDGIDTTWVYFKGNPKYFNSNVNTAYTSSFGDFYVSDNGNDKIYIKNMKLNVKFGDMCTANSECSVDKMCSNYACVPKTDDGSLYLSFKTTMFGVMENAKCANGWKASVIVKSGVGTSAVYRDVALTKVANSKIFNGQVALTGWTTKDNLLVFIKGQKHMQMKYGQDGQSGIYDGTVGKINVGVAADSSVVDLSAYPMMPGDYNQDGVINGVDFSEVKAKVSTHAILADNTYSQADLNGDCQYNTLDIVLLVKSLDTKQDEIY
jgi:hypothetical protein